MEMSLLGDILASPINLQWKIFNEYLLEFPLEIRFEFASVLEKELLDDKTDENNCLEIISKGNRLIQYLLTQINRKLSENICWDFKIKERYEQIIVQYTELLSNTQELKRVYVLMRHQLRKEQQWIYPTADQIHLLYTIDTNLSANIQHQLSDINASIEANHLILTSLQGNCNVYITQYHLNPDLQNQLQLIQEFENQENLLTTNFENLKLICNTVYEKFSTIFENIQKRYGYTNQNLLNVLINFYPQIFRNAFNIRVQVKNLMRIRNSFQNFLCILLKNSQNTLLSNVEELLWKVCHIAFIIVEQPPQIMLVNKKFNLKLQFLIGHIVEFLVKPTVHIRIINEDEALGLHRNTISINNIKGAGNFQVSNTEFSLNNANGEFTAYFTKNQLIEHTRLGKRAAQIVSELKCCILCISTIQFDDMSFTISTRSLPIVRISHGVQYEDALATILYDNSFSTIVREPFKIPLDVSWKEMSKALSTIFARETGKRLSEKDLNYCYNKLFGFESVTSPEARVTWTNFQGVYVDEERQYTFWQWFYAIMKLTKNHLRPFWRSNRNLIMGFRHKMECEELLKVCELGTFMLRFSDSVLGGITLTILAPNEYGEPQVYPAEAFTEASFTRNLNLMEIIRNLPCCKFFYPNISTDEVYREHIPPTPVVTSVNPGYIKMLRVYKPIFSESQN